MTIHDDLSNRLRHRLILGKFPVIECTKTTSSHHVVLDVGAKLFLQMAAPLSSDVKVGDLLTLYTEVLVQERPFAFPL